MPSFIPMPNTYFFVDLTSVYGVKIEECPGVLHMEEGFVLARLDGWMILCIDEVGDIPFAIVDRKEVKFYRGGTWDLHKVTVKPDGAITVIIKVIRGPEGDVEGPVYHVHRREFTTKTIPDFLADEERIYKAIKEKAT
jgi:hypothetical protein